MVAVAQLVESRIVIPVVVGSSPISHPTPSSHFSSPHFSSPELLVSALLFSVQGIPAPFALARMLATQACAG